MMTARPGRIKEILQIEDCETLFACKRASHCHQSHIAAAASDDGQSDGKRPDTGAGQTDLGYTGEATVAAKITQRIHQRVTRGQ